MPRFLTVTAILLATINAFAGVSYSFRTDTKPRSTANRQLPNAN
jgi:hypothetical protein